MLQTRSQSFDGDMTLPERHQPAHKEAAFPVPGKRDNTRFQDRCPISVHSPRMFTRSSRGISHLTF